MKKILYISIISLLTVSCTYKKEGLVVKDTNGVIYKLENGSGNEMYKLIEVDTTDYTKLFNDK